MMIKESSKDDCVKTAVSPPQQSYIILTVGSVYVAFGILVALIQGGLPPVFRAKGLSVAQSSMVFLLYLPFGLSFLWSPLLDRFHPPILSKRLGWIVIMQAFVALALVIVAFSEQQSAIMLIITGFCISIAAATMDLALDAMTVEMVGEKIRPLASAFKLGGLSIGAIIGGGIILGLLNSIGWTVTFLSVAILTLVATLPVFLLSEKSQPYGGSLKARGNSFKAFFKRQYMTRRLAALLFISASMFPLTMLNRMMLLDMGMPLEDVGWIVGTLQPVFLLIAALLGGPLMTRLGSSLTFYATSACALFAVFLLLFGFIYSSIPVAITGAISISVSVGMLFVVMGSYILEWAQGEQAATDYAIMFNASRLMGAVAGMLAGSVVTLLGWPLFYAGGAFTMLIACFVLGRVIHLKTQVNQNEDIKSVELAG